MHKPKLLDQVRTIAVLRQLSPCTTEAYTHWIKWFVLFHQKRHPAQMRALEVRKFLSHLAQVLKVSASTQNQTLNALAFSYHQVLQSELGDIGNIPRAKRPQHFPLVFSHAEVQKVLRDFYNTEHLWRAFSMDQGSALWNALRRE